MLHGGRLTYQSDSVARAGIGQSTSRTENALPGPWHGDQITLFQSGSCAILKTELNQGEVLIGGLMPVTLLKAVADRLNPLRDQV